MNIHPDRRQFLGAIGAAFAAPLVGAAETPFANKDELLRALIKLRGSLDDRLILWWMNGRRYGVVDDKLTPFYDMQIGSFARFEEVPGEGFAMRMLELSYFTDIETGELMETFTNPYTNKTVEIPDQIFGPYSVMLTTEGVVLEPNPLFGEFELETGIGPAIVQGDDVWIRDDSSADVDSPNPAMGKHIYNEIVTYHGSLTDIQSPGVLAAPADINFQSLTSWRPWMQIEGVNGHTIARATGRKVFTLEDMPAKWLELARRKHPDIIADPEAAMAAGPAPHG